MINSDNYDFKSIVFSAASIACSAGIGYLGTWCITSMDPTVGAIYSFNQHILYEGFSPLFHFKKSSWLRQLIGNIIEIVGAIGITKGISEQVMGKPLALKQLLVISSTCIIIPSFIGLTIGFLKPTIDRLVHSNSVRSFFAENKK